MSNPAGVGSASYSILGSVTNANGLAGYTAATVTVNKVAPAFTSTDLSLSETNANEGDTITLSGQFTDLDLASSYTVTIDWGDGSTSTVLNEIDGQVFPSATTLGLFTYSTTHQYLYNAAAATPGSNSDSYKIKVSVTDGVNTVSAATPIVVAEVPPAIQLESNPTDDQPESSVVYLTAVTTDADPLATDQVVWSLADLSGNMIASGTGPSITLPNNGSGFAGIVTATVTSSDGGSDTDVAQVVVIDQSSAVVAIEPSTITISGGSSPGTISLSANADRLITMVYGTDNLVDAQQATIPVELDGFSEVGQIFKSNALAPGRSFGTDALAGQGGDTLVAGAGNDLLVAGPGADSLVGGSGDDTFVSGGGDDTLVGGSGPAVFQINPGPSVVVIGSTSGTNTLDFSSSSEAITISLSQEAGQSQTVDSSGDSLTLEGQFNTYIASSHGDSVVANDDNDLIYATAGNASISSGSGQDSIVGGSGNDIIYALSGNATITGGSGNESIVGGSGNDIIYTLSGNTTITGGSGNESIVGGSGNDIIYTLSGNTTITGGSGNDSIVGGSGNDIIYTLSGNTTITGGSGNESIVGGSGNDIIYTLSGNTTITGGSGTESIVGGSGNDIIYTLSGNATITAGSGNESIVGGSGNDIIYTLSGNTSISGGSGNESIVGGSGNDIIYTLSGNTSITGGSGNESIVGGSGNDIIYLTSGNASITGGSGHDSIVGGSGNDIIYLTSGNATITGGSGNESIVGGSGNDLIYLTSGNATISGGSGHESIFGGSGNDIIYGNYATVTINGGSGDDLIVGGTGDDMITGGSGNDSIIGGTGNDTIVGGTGNDTIIGGTGNDSIVGGSGADSIIGGSGTDIIFGGLQSSTITGGSGNDTITGGNGNDMIDGGTGNDSIVGGFGAESIVGGSGNDVLIAGNLSSTITGGSGDDLIFGSGGGDMLFGGTGDSTIVGGTGNDSIMGGSGDDVIYGGTGDSTIAAGTGNSTISGGQGNDVLTGGGTGSWLMFYGSANMTLTDTTFSTSGGSLPATFSTISGFQNAILAAGTGDFTLDASAFAGSVILQGGTGNDTLIGAKGPDTLEGGAGNDSLVGGGAGDTFAFNSSSSGSQMIDEPSDGAGSWLDFSQAPAGISINLSQSGAQSVMPATQSDGPLSLTLADPLAIDNVLGSSYDDTIIGNANDNTLVGAGGQDLIAGMGGNDVIEGAVTRTVFLDFNTYELPGQHAYTKAERDAIQAQITADYSAFSYVFTQTQPQSGPYTTITFNDPTLVGLEGGVATEIDWRDLDISGTTTLTADGLEVIPADFAGVNVNNFLGGPGEPAATTTDFIGLSATIAAHELGHISGLEHGDAFGPIGSGIYFGVNPVLYSPAYPGATDADESILHIMASGASVNATLEDAINDPFFGEREAIALSYGENGSPTNEQSTAHYAMGDAQPISLAPLVVPDTDLEGENSDQVFDVTAADVVGYLGETSGASNTDYYAFTAQAGTLINFQLMSVALTRSEAPAGTPPTDYNQGPFDTYLVIYNSNGQVIEFNDNSFQDADSSIIDLTLPYTGTYYAMVTSSPNSVALKEPLTGNYELFMYTFATGGDPPAGDSLYAGSGDDTLYAGSADDSIAPLPQDTIVYGSGTVDLLKHAPYLNVSAGPNQVVNEGTPVTLTGSFLDPENGDTHTYDWHVVASSGQQIADGHGLCFTFTPGNAGTYTVTFTAMDPNGGSGSAQVVITSNDVPPVLTAPTATQSVYADGSATINLGSLATVGVGPFTDTVQWGDGQTSTFDPAGSGSLSLAHNYATGGMHTISETVVEDDGGRTTASFSINVLVDTTPPTSHVVNALGTSQSSDTFPVWVAYSDPAGPAGAVAAGVSSLSLYVSVNNGPFSLYQTMNFAPSASGTATFTFTGQDRNIYAFHSIAVDAAGNIESKNGNTIEASTSVPDLNPPVTHVLSSSPSYSWGSAPPAEFSGLSPSAYSSATGKFTLNWAGFDPDQNTGLPSGSIALVNIYAEVDHGTPTLIGQLNGGKPNSSGVYSGSLSYSALDDGLPHTYSFYSVGIDDEQKVQYAPAVGPTTPDVTFSGISYTIPLGIQTFAVEKFIAERSFIQYLDVDFNQTTATSSVLSGLSAELATKNSNRSSYVELLWYGENLSSNSMPIGSVNLFNAGTTAILSFTGNDLSINFGANGITSLLTETGVTGTGKATTNFGDGWYALGVDPTGNPGNGQVFWLPFYRLFGSATGNSSVSGPYTMASTDAYVVYNAEGQSGTLLDADVDGSGAVNSKDLTYTVAAKGDSVGSTPPASFPQFQLFAGANTAVPVGTVPVTQAEVKSLLPAAIDAWQAAGLDNADVRKLENVTIQVGNLGTSILGLEASGAIMINQTAAGFNWYVAAGTASNQAFGLAGPSVGYVAGLGSPAADDVDLLTVLEHELGHVIGLADNNQAGDLMDITLGFGVRRTPTAADLAAIGQGSSAARMATLAGPAAGGLTARVQSPRLFATVDAALASIVTAAAGHDDADDTDANGNSRSRAVVRRSSIGMSPARGGQNQHPPRPFRGRAGILFEKKGRRLEGPLGDRFHGV
jgi:Ca2+-binding RTX toxin-like protein